MSRQDIQCVLLADRHFALMEGVRGLLETTFDAVVMVADEVSLIESASRLNAALAIVDFSLIPGEGLKLVRRFRTRCPEMKLIVIGDHDEASVSRAALEAGADGYVLKRALATDMLEAVDAVLGGTVYVSPGVKTTAGRSASNGRQ